MATLKSLLSKSLLTEGASETNLEFAEYGDLHQQPMNISLC